MTHSWDRPLFPDIGDDDAYSTYASVGRLTSEWEAVESELSHLFAHFIGKYGTHEAYDEYYDKSKTGTARLKTLQESAEAYFKTHPHQDIEGDFSGIIKKVSGFSDRRHEIAHGILRPWHWFKFLMFESGRGETSRSQFCIVPPHYHRNWFDDDRRWPVYIFEGN